MKQKVTLETLAEQQEQLLIAIRNLREYLEEQIARMRNKDK